MRPASQPNKHAKEFRDTLCQAFDRCVAVGRVVEARRKELRKRISNRPLPEDRVTTNRLEKAVLLKNLVGPIAHVVPGMGLGQAK